MVAVGKPSLAYAREGCRFYLERLAPMQPVEMKWVRVGAGPAETARRVLAAVGDAMPVAMDETGVMLSTREIREKLAGWRDDGVREVAFLVGGADGHVAGVWEAVPTRWALGKATLQHELALLVWLEQLYRVASLEAGSPYHREG